MNGKTYLITGASSGVGRALAIEISKRGGQVVLVARNEEKLNETLEQMEYKEKHICIPFDLTDFEHYNELFQCIKERQIILNGMVHCAGIAPITPLRTISTKKLSEVFDIHYFAFMELVKFYAKRGMSEGGSIVAISSTIVEHPLKCMSIYASAKAAVEAACKNLAIELYEKKIRINTVVLGGVNTEMVKNVTNIVPAAKTEVDDWSRVRQLMSIAEVSDVMGAIMFLLGQDSRYITGRKIFVDGGIL